MRGARRLLPALLVACIAACSSGPSDEERLLRAATDGAILPLHDDFLDAAAGLQAAVSGFCAQPAEAGYAAAREAWKTAMTRWQSLEVIDFGPVTVDNQAWKIQFWPDRKNLVARQLEDLLASGAPLTAEGLEAGSVVMQGLTAAEYLLFDAEGGTLPRYAADDDAAARRCRLLGLIAAHTVLVAERLRRGWAADDGNYAAQFTAPGEGNPDFPTADDAVAALLDSVVGAIETAKNDKLAEPLGLDNDLGIPKPYAVEAWRSKASLALLYATVDGARRLYYAGPAGGDAFGVEDLLRARAAAALAGAIDAAFAAELAARPPAGLSLFDAVGDPGEAAALVTYHDALDALAELLKNELPAELGVTLGFNDKDGD